MKRALQTIAVFVGAALCLDVAAQDSASKLIPASLTSGAEGSTSGSTASTPGMPKVFAPTRPRTPYTRYPWKTEITLTVFWVGEKPTPANPTPNHKSSWDGNWVENYGGFDDPDPAKRGRDYTPVGFTPGQNPFYIALPYNDLAPGPKTKPEAAKVIPWYDRTFKQSGRTICKSRWVAIKHNGKVCFAQWEDCGPWNTDDWQYVFGNRRPKTTKNGGAGIDVSPAVRDYLEVKTGEKVDWRFVELSEVQQGPWMIYGQNNHFVHLRKSSSERESERLAELERLRDAWFKKTSPNSWER